MALVVYVGPFAAVDVPLGRSGAIHFESGTPVDVPDDLAASLLAQGDDTWQTHNPNPAQEGESQP